MHTPKKVLFSHFCSILMQKKFIKSFCCDRIYQMYTLQVNIIILDIKESNKCLIYLNTVHLLLYEHFQILNAHRKISAHFPRMTLWHFPLIRVHFQKIFVSPAQFCRVQRYIGCILLSKMTPLQLIRLILQTLKLKNCR